jgi:hypothetical protein
LTAINAADDEGDEVFTLVPVSYMTQVVAGTNYKVIYKRTNAAATESD